MLAVSEYLLCCARNDAECAWAQGAHSALRWSRRPPVRFLDDEELAYVATRAREVHDFWHVLFGCHTNNFGELALKAVEFVQVRQATTECVQL